MYRPNILLFFIKIDISGAINVFVALGIKIIKKLWKNVKILPAV